MNEWQTCRESAETSRAVAQPGRGVWGSLGAMPKPAAPDGGAGPSERRMSGTTEDFGAQVKKVARRMSVSLMDLLGGGAAPPPAAAEPKQENGGARVMRRASQTLLSLFGGSDKPPNIPSADTVRPTTVPRGLATQCAKGHLRATTHDHVHVWGVGVRARAGGRGKR